ncbi:MAG TPA: hypothetical protein EYP57_05890 [Thermodesulfobacteriaceae bacterium]|nr:hypothetical protein [Thermodesulfobacteriaceae bacterium]
MTKKEILTVTKTGMGISFCALVYTGMRPACRKRPLMAHTWWGVALAGFAVWHYNAHTARRRQLVLEGKIQPKTRK